MFYTDVLYMTANTAADVDILGEIINESRARSNTRILYRSIL